MKVHTPCIIGIVGLPGAGKTSVAAHLVEQKFTHIILSDFIKEEIIRSGLTDFSRMTYQSVGNKMREEHGGETLAVLAVKKIKKEHIRHAVIDGIRNIQEIAYLRKQKGFHLLGITADARSRFTRLSARLHKDKQIHRSYADFIKEEKREDSLGSRKNGLRVRGSLKLADATVRNNHGRKELYNAIDRLLRKWEVNI